MDRVDELNQEAIKFNRYQQQAARQQQDKHRFLMKRVSTSFITCFDIIIYIYINKILFYRLKKIKFELLKMSRHYLMKI